MAGVCLLAVVVLARDGVVITQSGQRFEGNIKEQPRSVTIESGGIETTVNRSDVASLIYSDNVAQLFHERLDKLGSQDVDGRISLAQWAVDQNRYDLALQSLEQARKIDPNNRQVYDFIRVIAHQRDLHPATGRTAPTTQPSATRPATQPAQTVEARLLSPEDINTIRQLELKPQDLAVRVRISNDVRRQYVGRIGGTFRAFDDLSPAQQAAAVIRDGDPQWRKGVEILNDPPALAQYKRLIQPVILAGCAASGCHGNVNNGGFELYKPATSDAVSYTNFYILTQYIKQVPPPAATQGAFVGAADLRMLNRVRPEESLLAAYGLPRGPAKSNHPDVRGFRPIYRNRDAMHYQELMRWLGRTLVNVQPDYGITDVQLPQATTAPATTQSIDQK